MAYDLRNKTEPSYSTQSPMYSRPATTALPLPSHHSPMYGQASGKPSSLYHRPLPPLAPQGDVPQCTFHFDFDLEKKILAEANQKESQIWSRLPVENLPSRGSDQASKKEYIVGSYGCFHLNGCTNLSLRK
ncbi:uncharacterized protein LOC107022262 [Solanum pennellii]|uniref:Uncharacterized protein LOC107022262 n=1 Tax=Solanum pennellii TaxID=28526 RepID=A0ABM1H000_SOLPN|nr:uncharacterized protein LOC107022262 [Solanum pennellii]